MASDRRPGGRWGSSPPDGPQARRAFESTTRFGKLVRVKVMLVGRKVYMRFKCTTGDAMGMNMVTARRAPGRGGGEGTGDGGTRSQECHDVKITFWVF